MNELYVLFNMKNDKILYRDDQYHSSWGKSSNNKIMFLFVKEWLDLSIEYKDGFYQTYLKWHRGKILVVPYDEVNDELNFVKAFKL